MDLIEFRKKIENLRPILQRVADIREKYDEFDKITGRKFNLFKIIRRGYEEMSLHSAFIGELLNPMGVHKMGDKFLRLFMTVLPINEEKKKELLNISGWETSTEKFFSEGRIDILMESNEQCIIIENKIYASDELHQLYRYSKYKENSLIFYLTLFGSKPSDQSIKEENNISLKKNKDYYIISYRDNIINWLNKCLVISINKPYIRESINQYLDLIEELTYKRSDDMNKEIQNYIKESVKSNLLDLTLVDELRDNIDVMREEFVNKFWEDMKSLIMAKIISAGFKEENIFDASDFNVLSKNNLPKCWKVFGEMKIEIDATKIVFFYWQDKPTVGSFWLKLEDKDSKRFNEINNLLNKKQVKYEFDRNLKNTIVFSEESWFDIYNQYKWLDDTYVEQYKMKIGSIIEQLLEIIKNI